MVTGSQFVLKEHAVKGMLLSKALVWNFSFINKNGYFIMDTDTFGYLVV